MKHSYAITFATFNQLDYTQKFIQSLDRSEVDFSRIVVVDNGSTDGTRDWLLTQGFGEVILNHRNLGCGVAWNQGALALQAEWTVVMNNDVICAPGWLNALLNQANHAQVAIASPAMIEGDFDYDFGDFLNQMPKSIHQYVRNGQAHAVCMAIHQSVWNEIGYFMPVPKLLGYEDLIFFQRAKECGIPQAIIGQSWIHHFGMVTQKMLKLEKHLDERSSLGDRDLMKRYLQIGWFERKFGKRDRRNLLRRFSSHELATFGMTVHGIRSDGSYTWC